VTKLHQILAVERGQESRAQRRLTDLHRLVQTPAVISGISRKYQPLSDEPEAQLPDESTKVQILVPAVLDEMSRLLTRVYDLAATKEEANTAARADVKVGDEVLLADVPVGTLLFLEKRLDNVRTFIEKLPTLDPAEQWHYDSTTNAYATEPVRTARPKKQPRVLELSPATERHQAQVQVFNEDVVVGYWTTVKYSGAIPELVRATYLERVTELIAAVRKAREAANEVDVTDVRVGEQVFSYLFAPVPAS
jgi:hypothetical protein